MSSRCRHCAGLSIRHLIELARAEFTADVFPQTAFYQHHSSFSDLETSAQQGCDLCRLILDTFRGVEEVGGGSNGLTEWLGDDVGSSMYAAAKELDASDVKISIDSSHLYVGSDLDQVRVFDTLLVQVGLPRGRAGDEEVDEDEDGSVLEPLKFGLSVSDSSPLYVDRLRVGQFRPDPDLGSSANFDLVRTWMSECEEEHGPCAAGALQTLPTRVIDVGPIDGSEHPKLVLSGGRKAQYTALSHCWGGRITPVLTTATVDVFRQSIPFDTLPANFRDAVTITRNLGIQYLWIDSLCIIQDSKSDWETESKKMSYVYMDASITISAMASPGSTTGILSPPPMPPRMPQPATLGVMSDTAELVEVTIERLDFDRENMWQLDYKSPLSSRGWTLQESILSTRQLYYGKTQVYWKCRAGFKAADGSPLGTHFPEFIYAGLQSVLLSDAAPGCKPNTEELDAVLEDYYKLVNAYSTRWLTFGSDKLPAFSGIAQRLAPTVGGAYLAGLWSADINNGLLWESEVGHSWHVKLYRAPSWSWAVTDGIVMFDYVRYNTRSPFDMQLLHYDVKPRDKTNPFGEIESGRLLVEGLTKRLVRSSQIVEQILPGFSIGIGNFDEPQDGDDTAAGTAYRITDLFHIENDHGEDYILSMRTAKVRAENASAFDIDFKAFPEEDYLALIVRHVGPDADVDTNPTVHALALRRVESHEDQVFERVGLLRISSFTHEWLKGCNRRQLTLV